jgi:membrane-associated phospholipid phosphatase
MRAEVASLVITIGVFAAITLKCPSARAEEPVFGSPLEDLKLYVTAPLRWDEEDWLYFGGAVAAIGGSHALDSRVRSHFANGSNAALTGEDKNSLRDALPTLALIVGTGTGALFFRNTDGYRETWALFEAGLLSSATSETLRFAAGRERPDATTSPNEWRKGGTSFPSLHATAASAVGMVFAESGGDEYRWLRRIIGYGIVAGTTYMRVRDNDHWLSDTVAGGAVGFATARFVLNRQEANDRQPSAFSIQPMKGGWMLSYSMQTH